MPQNLRSPSEENYFHRSLQTMSGIIRNCGFIYFYPPFEPRLWILYEITEFMLTCSGITALTPDIKTYLNHIDEMISAGVQATLVKHGYRCSYDRDRQYLTSWLELLILLKRINLDVGMIRNIMDHLTWQTICQTYHCPRLSLNKFEGTLIANGQVYEFTPFPRWVGDTIHSIPYVC
jgi:hypothetical protein